MAQVKYKLHSVSRHQFLVHPQQKENCNKFWRSAKAGDVSAVLAWLEKGCDVDFVLEDQFQNPVRQLKSIQIQPNTNCNCLYFSIVVSFRFLHLCGDQVFIKVFCCCQGRNTALFLAAMKGNADMVKMLVGKGANVDVVDGVTHHSLIHNYSIFSSSIVHSLTL